ncbi:MAG: PD-(D/E)XK nuclease family protein, partial [Sulfolobales archaeon]
PTPVEFLKVVGQEVHRALQDVLRSDGWEVEVGVSLQLDGFVLRGRIDAVKEDAILEFKTVGSLPTDGPYSSHVLQAQAYLAMVGGSRAYLVYLSRNDGKVKVYRVDPNKQALKQVVERAKQLHQALKSGRPPQSTRGPWCEHCSFKLACRR